MKRVYGFSAVDVGRNMNAGVALLEGFDEIMWIDSRIAFHPDAVDRLRAHRLPIIGGAVPKTTVRGFECNFVEGTDEIVFGEEGGVMEVEHTSCSFLLTRCEVFERMQIELDLPLCNQTMAGGVGMIPYFKPFHHETHGVHRYLSEDFAFMERARQCGYRVFVDTSLRLGHVGAYPYTWEDVGSERTHFKTYVLRQSS